MSSLFNTIREQLKVWALAQRQAQPETKPTPATDRVQHDSAHLEQRTFLEDVDHNEKSPDSISTSNKTPDNADIIGSSLLNSPFAVAKQQLIKTAPQLPKINHNLDQLLTSGYTVADVLALNPTEFSSLKGVGNTKVQILKAVQQEIRELAEY